MTFHKIILCVTAGAYAQAVTGAIVGLVKDPSGAANPVARKFIEGWNINGIILIRSLPFSVMQQQGVLSTGTGNRPDRIGSGVLSTNPTPDRWFDLAAFRPATENTATYGNSGRTILRGPCQQQLDFSIVKDTRYRERFHHQFRVDFFNAFNHPQFGAPGASTGTAAAGVISSLLYTTPMRQIQFAMKLGF